MSITVHSRDRANDAPPRPGRRVRLDRRRFLATGLGGLGAYVVAYQGAT